VRSDKGEVIRPSYDVHPHQVSARIIDVETAQLVGLGVIDQDIQNGTAMSAAITNAVMKMLETMTDQVNPNLPKRAVYVQGRGNRRLGGNQSENALYSYTLEALFTRSRYNGDFVVVERSEAFTAQIDREQRKQRSGAIADDEISCLGRQYGIAEICIASIEFVMGTYNINARLVNVERASVVNASQLRHFKSEKSKAGNLMHLRNIAVQTVEDMIPRRITEAEIEEDRRIEAEREKMTRTAWMTGAVLVFGGGASWNMNDIDPNYFKSAGGQWNPINGEFYRQHIKFFRFGGNLEFGGIGYDKDLVKSIYPDVISDSTLALMCKINAFARLYPVDFLFLSGGAGWSWYSISSKNASSDKINIVNISTPIFPVGGGIVLGLGGLNSEWRNMSVAVETLYNIVPFKDRTAAYMSINAGFKMNIRITEDKKHVRELI
jgi:hypothetical protein